MLGISQVNIEENSEVLNAFLQSLLVKGYRFDCLVEHNYSFYVIQRSGDNKCGLITEKGWFNGKDFNGEEYWFDGIDTQEIGNRVFIECIRENDSLLFELIGNDLIPAEVDSIDSTIQDLIDSTVCQANGKIN